MKRIVYVILISFFCLVDVLKQTTFVGLDGAYNGSSPYGDVNVLFLLFS